MVNTQTLIGDWEPVELPDSYFPRDYAGPFWCFLPKDEAERTTVVNLLSRRFGLSDDQIKELRRFQRQRQQAGFRGRLRGDLDGPEHFYWAERFRERTS